MLAEANYQGALVEFLAEGRLRPALVMREQGNQLVVRDASGRERTISRDLVLIRHHERRVDPKNAAATLESLEQEHERLAAELDLNLLWEVVHEQSRSFSAEGLAELFFGRRATVATSVMLEALLNDRLYFIRRHMEFVARDAEQVERLRVQQDRVRLRSEASRKTRALIRAILEDGSQPESEEATALGIELRRYLENPFTRSRELTAMLEAAVSDVNPAEAAFEVLDRLGQAPDLPRFALIGGIRSHFGDDALTEAINAAPAPRPASDDNGALTIDDEETLEVDDALSCEPLDDGTLRVRIHIALVADFVTRDGPMDKEARARGATVYLPEITVRMLPERIACGEASLVADRERHVLTTDVRVAPDGSVSECSIYPSQIRVKARLSYDDADLMLCSESSDETTLALKRLHRAAMKLRERRRNAGALLINRREPKIRVSGGQIEVKLIDNTSPSRELVAEFMVLTNHAAARFATDRRLPIIYRVQPITGAELMAQRPRLSLYPEYHAGVGLDCYAQVSSPIRRYMDLVLQRQLVTSLSGRGSNAYQAEELLEIIANAESTEAEGRELERRAKRYWMLRYLESHAMNQPLVATVYRDGAVAELDAYAARGTLHGAPNLSSQSRVLVQISRIDPLRGWLAFDYLRTTEGAAEGAR